MGDQYRMWMAIRIQIGINIGYEITSGFIIINIPMFTLMVCVRKNARGVMFDRLW